MYKYIKRITSFVAMFAILFVFAGEAMAKKSKTLKNTQKKVL